MAPHDDSTTSLKSPEAGLITCDRSMVAEEGDYHFTCTSDDEAAAHSLTTRSAEQPLTASIDPPAALQLVGILRQSRYSYKPQENLQRNRRDGLLDAPADEEESNAVQPAHWPTIPRVHFIDDHTSDSLVTCTFYRPYTVYAEVTNHYYTAADFDQFKREYRALLKAQRQRKRGVQTSAKIAKNDGGLLKNSSFWRSKVHGRFYDSSNGTFSQPEKEHISTSSSAGAFSSVFDVAKEAVSLFSGSSNNNNSPPSKAGRQQQLLVDTLYSNLF